MLNTYKNKIFSLSLLTFLLAPSCSNGPTEVTQAPVAGSEAAATDSSGPRDELNLSIMNPIFYNFFSLLRDVNKASKLQNTADIKYPVCLYGNVPIDADSLNKGFQSVEIALNKWSDALEADPFWPVRSITVEKVGDSTRCPSVRSGVRVLKVFADKVNQRAVANFYFTQIVTPATSEGGSMFGQDGMKYLMLHEIGHILGLGDAYVEKGYQTPEFQAPSAMNGQSAELTEDDVDAIKHLWAKMSGRTSAVCPVGYIVGPASENRFFNTFCIKTKSLGASDIRTFANKCLTVNGNKVVQADCTGDRSQIFDISAAPNEIALFRSQASGQCLDIQLGMPFNGTKTIVWPCHGKRNQQFAMRKAGSIDIVNIIPQSSQKCLDVAWESRDTGAGIVQWKCHDKKNQKFYLPGLYKRN